MPTVGIYPEDGVEDLHAGVGVQRRDDLRDAAQVPVEELTQPPVVVDGTATRSTADEQLMLRQAERILTVDEHEAGPLDIGTRRRNPVCSRPRDGVGCSGGVVDPPHRLHRCGIEVRRHR
jgi:hypothetical protein